MKKSAKNLVLLAIVYLIASCSESEQLLPNLEDEGFKKSDPKTVTVPFKTSFIGEYTSVDIPPPDGACDSEFACLVNVDFVGTGTHLGKFSGNFEFCACGPGGAYGPTVSSMVAANGDILYISGEGFVIDGRLDDHPEYVISYWRDPFVILGGTGRFEGATGEGWTDDYNSSEDPNSHHNWTGTITMVKGKGH